MTDPDAFEPESPAVVRQSLRDLGRDPESALAQTAIEYARAAELEHPVNRKPDAIAVGAIYICSVFYRDTITQQQLSNSTGVTIPTIRNTYQEIVEYCVDVDAISGDDDAPVRNSNLDQLAGAFNSPDP